MDTIFALATAPGRAGVSVIRISGSRACAAVEQLCDVPADRGVRRLVDPQSSELLDEALILRFETGRSFTGETVIELHLHGSTAIVARVLAFLGSIDGLRVADAGEFTRRALENGRLDLAQVEGLADLIDAETEAQHRQAVRVFAGALGQLAEQWRVMLIRCAALIEATIDFADEDVPEDVGPEVQELLDNVAYAMREQVKGAKASERIRDGFEVAIVGAPNAGKSTLLNHLAGRAAAITSDTPGTTRDVIEVRMNIGGYAVTLLDTAGIRSAEDGVEQLGIDLALQRARSADVRLFLTGDAEITGVTPFDGDVVAAGKADLGSSEGFAISGKTGEGVDELLAMLINRFEKLTSGAGLAIRTRHKMAMENSLLYIQNVKEALENDVGLDIAAAELRAAVLSVDSIVGRVDVEDLLGEIFSSFCIGK